MSDLAALWTRLPATPDWTEFRASADQYEARLARSLERLLVHDPRCPTAQPARPSLQELARRSLLAVLEEWETKPTDMTPELWLLKRGTALLDDELDLVASPGSGIEVGERAPQTVNDAAADERSRWLEVASLTNPRLPQLPSHVTDAALLDVERALSRLPELRRRAVTHRFLDGLSLEELSLMLDISEDDVRQELDAGVKLLRLEVAPAA